MVSVEEKADALVSYVGKFRGKIIYKIIVYDQVSLSNPRKRALKKKSRDFPGGPGLKTLCFHCKGREFNPWLGN